MTPTQMARRSDALYADGSCGMTRRVLCDMVAQRESDLEDARAESAKLRELLEDTLMQPHDYCQKYGIEYDGWDSVNDHLDARMRELGIEVDG